jgi:hypothetical protein
VETITLAIITLVEAEVVKVVAEMVMEESKNGRCNLKNLRKIS